MYVKTLLFVGMLQFCSAQHLLFKTGFEGNMLLPPIPRDEPGGRAYFQYFSGTDSITGYNWTNFPFQDAIAVSLHNEPYGTDLVAHHFFNKLDSSVFHSGRRSLYLGIEGYQNFVCCPQVPLQSSAINNPVKQVYYRFWEKLPASLGSYLSTNKQYYSRAGTSWKTADDYRSHLDFNTTWDYTSLHPHMQLDALGMSASIRSPGACPYIDPITGSLYNDCTIWRKFVDIDNNKVTVPIDKWFLVEVYFKRSIGNDGAFDTAINGQLVAHTFGPNYGADIEEIRDMYWISLYSSFFPMSQWIDDLEIWDAPPCNDFPCGSDNTTTYTGPSAPFIISRYGAVGEVGIPFSFQLQAAQKPTDWRVSGGSLPVGLSINSRTGLISGTPTTAGTMNFYIEAWNSMGRSSRYMEIQIQNRATAPPSISSFTATPSTIDAGQWIQLRWVQSGATSLSIDQGIGDVTGADPFPVRPSGTTTYILRAANKAGATSKQVTVIFSGANRGRPSQDTRKLR